MTDDDGIPDDHFVMDLFRSAETMLSQVEEARRYPHREGGGAAKEDILRTFLAGRLPSTWQLTKGCIKDSLGKTTGEYDIIAFDPTARLVLGKSSDDRIVVPVESVRLIIEVRTKIDKAAILDSQKKWEQLAALTRFYKPNLLGFDDNVVQQGFRDGVSATKSYEYLPGITVGLVGFGGIKNQTTLKYLKEHGRRLEYVIDLGSYTILNNPESEEIEPLYLPTQGLGLSYFLLETVTSIERWHSVPLNLMPDWRKYFRIHK